MDPEKKQKMEENGYEFDSDLSCFINRKDGKIFSSDWIDQKNLNTIQITISLPHTPTMWKLFFNPDQPHEELRSFLFEKYGTTP